MVLIHDLSLLGVFYQTLVSRTRSKIGDKCQRQIDGDTYQQDAHHEVQFLVLEYLAKAQNT